MRNLISMDTIQIEITNVCINKCSNCSRHIGHHQNSFFMTFDDFKISIDSMIDYPNMIGFQGGEPLLHPDFNKFCEYAASKIEPKRLGLWTTFPKGYEHYREIICKTFHHVFLNDHTRSDIYHHPGLVGIEEVFPDKNIMWTKIDRCWAQEGWSASINPNGAFFCEIAAALSILFPEEDSKAWNVEPGWWWRIPKDFKEQMEQWCPRCGFAAPLSRRPSVSMVDDISPKNFERLKMVSPKIKNGRYKISNLKTTENQEALAAYKDNEYRDNIAKRYGIFLYINDQHFWTPILHTIFDPEQVKSTKSLFEIYRERYKI
jgi:hypothetical protein